VPQSQCTQVVPEGLANTVTSILQGVLTVPGATGTQDALSGRPAAAKTGTVDNYDGSWFAGYTPQLASAVWAGIPSSPNKSLGGLNIGGRYYGAVFGATLAGRIWQSTMNAALQGVPPVAFSGVDRYYFVGVRQSVPDVVGLPLGVAESELRQDGFTPVVGQAVDSTIPLGEVASMSPGAGSQVAKGATVVLHVSDGVRPHSPPRSETTVSPTPRRSGTPTPAPSATPTPAETPTPSETPSNGVFQQRR
jgi:membrane peptidoglycan carboxypeptidase